MEKTEFFENLNVGEYFFVKDIQNKITTLPEFLLFEYLGNNQAKEILTKIVVSTKSLEKDNLEIALAGNEMYDGKKPKQK